MFTCKTLGRKRCPLYSTISYGSANAGESNRSSRRLQNSPSPPLAVFCGLTVDRSGSMSNMHTTASEGVFKCIEEQIKGAEENGQNGYLFLTTFDNHITKIHNNTNFKDIDIKMEDVLAWMKPRGCTKLYDTAIQDLDNIIMAVDNYKENLSAIVKKLNPRISTVWVCCTDGFDNYSLATCEDFRKKVKEAKKAGVQCIFIAANQDAVLTGQQFGFDRGSSMTFGANNIGAAQAFRSVSENIRQATASGLSVSFTQAQRVSSLATSMDNNPDSDSDYINQSIIIGPPTIHRTRNIVPLGLKRPVFN